MRKINDNEKTLLEQLIDAMIIPYYEQTFISIEFIVKKCDINI